MDKSEQDWGNSPGFTCADCGRSVGAGKPGPNKPWEPQPCFWCREKAQRQAVTKRRREGPRALAGLDVDKVIAWMLQLPVFVELIPKRKRGRKLGVEVVHLASKLYRGTAFMSRFRVRISGGPLITQAHVLMVCIHELTHIATPRAHHGERFRRVLQRAVREAWGFEVSLDTPRKHHSNIAYAMDQVVVHSLEVMIKAGTLNVAAFEPDAVPVKLPRAVASLALVEKRSAHAQTMLVKAERKLKLAKTVQQRWVRKVRYYEKQAAKRGDKPCK